MKANITSARATVLACIVGALLLPCSVLAGEIAYSAYPQAQADLLRRYKVQLQARQHHESPDQRDPDADEAVIEEEEEEASRAIRILSEWMVCHGDAPGLLQLINDWHDHEFKLLLADAEPHERTALLRIGMRQTMLRVSVLTAHARCPLQALITFNAAITPNSGIHAQADRDQSALHHAMNGLTRASLALAASEPVSEPELLHLLQVLQSESTSIPDLRKPVVDYQQRLQEAVLAPQTPNWRVIAGHTPPRAAGRKRGQWDWNVMSALLATFLWPNEVSLLEARGNHQAAAAWALADLFGLRPRTGLATMSYEPAAVVWRTYGQTATRTALQQAAEHIHIQPYGQGEGTIAWITLFGHELLLESGTQEGKTTTWWEPAQIREHFMRSATWQALWGEEPAAAQEVQ